MPTRSKKTILLKKWDDWSAGVGLSKDDGITPGMAYASGLLGLVGELRPAPFFNIVTSSVAILSSGWNLSGTVNWRIVGVELLPSSGSTVAVSGSASTGSANGTSLTLSNHVVPSGTDRFLVVTVHNETSSDPTNVKFGGVDLTKIKGSPGAPRVSIWRLINPSASTADVVISGFGAGEDIIASAQAYTGVHQTTPTSTADYDSANGSGPASIATTGTEANGMMVDALVTDDTTEEEIPDLRQTSILNKNQGSYVGRASYRAVSIASDHHFQYFLEAVANTDPSHPFLYAVRGTRRGADGNAITSTVVNKIDLSNADFATFEVGGHSLSTTTLGQPGQSAKYQGFWHFPMGNDNRARKLSIVGTGNVSTDTLDGVATPHAAGADHFTLLGDQLVGHVKEGVPGIPGLPGAGDQDGGVRILKVDGTVITAGDWGSAFPVGDKTERAAGLITLSGATFVLNRDGLYSFNSKGRSGEVFTDLRQWQNPHVNIPMSIWKGGITIPHPSGFLYYVPGELPVPFGVESKRDTWLIPPSGVTEIHSGLYHSSSVVGDFLYAIYQPDLSSTTALVMVAYGTPPEDVAWQVLGSITLNDAEYMAGIFTATSGRPLISSHVTPTVWFGEGADLNYVILDPKAGPFRARADTHRVNISGDSFMSELVFPQPVDLTEIVVYTQDMLSDSTDEWQLSFIVNATGDEENLAPIVGNGFTAIPLNNKKVHRLTLRVQWVATSAADRVPPTIAKIELYGSPTEVVVT